MCKLEFHIDLVECDDSDNKLALESSPAFTSVDACHDSSVQPQEGATATGQRVEKQPLEDCTSV